MDLNYLVGEACFRSTLFGVIEARASWTADISAMGQPVIYAVLEGKTFFDCPQTEVVELSVGDFVFLPRGPEHHFYTEPGATPQVSAIELLRKRPAGTFRLSHGTGDVSTRMVAFASFWDDFSKTVVAPMLPDVFVVRAAEFGGRGQALSLARLIEAEAMDPRPSAAILVNRLANALLSELLLAVGERTDWQEEWLKSGHSPQINRALHLIHSSRTNDWTTTDLARRVGLSRSAFTRKFKQTLGTSPGEYLVNHRLSKAATFLTDAKAEVAAAAELAGYDSIPSFIKAFRRRYGVAPGRFRQRSEANTDLHSSAHYARMEAAFIDGLQ